MAIRTLMSGEEFDHLPESAYELNRKVRVYLDASTTEVWVIYAID